MRHRLWALLILVLAVLAGPVPVPAGGDTAGVPCPATACVSAEPVGRGAASPGPPCAHYERCGHTTLHRDGCGACVMLGQPSLVPQGGSTAAISSGRSLRVPSGVPIRHFRPPRPRP